MRFNKKAGALSSGFFLNRVSGFSENAERLNQPTISVSENQ